MPVARLIIVDHTEFEQVHLILEQLIERTLRHTQMLGDVVHSHSLDAELTKHLGSLFDDILFLRHCFFRLYPSIT